MGFVFGSISIEITSSSVSNLPKPEIKIDEDIAFDNLVELIKNIPDEVKEKNIKESLEELEKNKELFN